MTNSQRLATVRARFIQWLADHRDEGVRNTDDRIVESILIRDGFYCGRRFDASSHQAVWFLEEDELKIYSNGGELLCVMTGTQIGQRATWGEEANAGTSPEIIKIPSAAEDDNLRRAA